MKLKRSSGVLLHPTSLPGKFGIGSLGKDAFDFVDFLVCSKQKLWQVLPMGPTSYGDSPYQSFSSFAGNPLLIDLDELVKQNLLSKSDLETKEVFDDGKVDYGRIITFKTALYKKAYNNFKKLSSEIEKAKFEIFCEKHKKWLEEYSLFMALKNHFCGKPWYEWEYDIKIRTFPALKEYREKLSDEINYHRFIQFEFFRQWYKLKSYANINNIKIIGDIPIFVALDSCDVWASPEIFHLDEDRRPTKVAGVPPDYFSATGQLWGNPLYNWDVLKAQNYKWWIERLNATNELVDMIRIDHFRGFAAYWAIPYGNKDAIHGTWEKGPGEDLFIAIRKELGTLPIIAEDLGFVTPDVEKLRDDFDFPGMKIIQFGFDSSEGSPYIPHLFPVNCVAYTGTHDNDTIVGWYEKASKQDKEYVKEYLNSDCKDVAWDLLRLTWASTAVMVIVPLQDVLSLGSEARMNVPGIACGNWQWRYKKGQLSADIKQKLRKLTGIYKR
ncbi:MAG: 4-alpha-glucanotransferase [bacterium]